MPDQLLNPRLATVPPYPAVRPLERLRRDLGVDRVVQLSSNECTFGPLPEAAVAYAEAIELHRYPNSGALPLREAIADTYGLEPGQVVVGNGADELIRFCALAFLTEDDAAVFPWPSFQSYYTATLSCGGKVLRAPLAADRGLDLDALLDAAGRSSSKLLFLANPNNPTGRLYPPEQVLDVVHALEGTICVLDEAYAEFAEPQPEGIRLLREGIPGIIVLRTFSKIYGLAALRIGYALTSPEIADALDRVRAIYNVNQPAQNAAIASIQARSSLGPRIASVQAGRATVEEVLRSAGLETQESEGNFVYAEGREGVARGLPARLLEEGVMVRGLAAFGAEDAIRVTVGSAEDIQVFARALEKVM